MRVIIDYNGKEYETPDTDETTAKNFADLLYDQFDSSTKLKLELKDGGYIILGKQALQSCVVRILP